MSNSYSVGDLITDALLKCGGVDQDEPEDGAATDEAIRWLNNTLRFQATRGLHMWRRQEIVLPLVAGQVSYLLGDALTDAEWAVETDFFTTTVATAAVSTSSTLVVNSAANFVNLDRVGIEQDDGTRLWTTATKVGNTLTLADALTANVAAARSVYFYTARPARPLRVLHARRRSNSDSVDVPVRIEAHNYYYDQPAKSSPGTAVHCFYQPTLVSGSLFVWQPAGDVNQQLRLTVERPFALVTSTQDIPDIPDEWNVPFTYMLSKHLEPSYGLMDDRRRAELRADADRYEAEALAFDEDTGSIYFAPDRQQGRRR